MRIAIIYCLLLSFLQDINTVYANYFEIGDNTYSLNCLTVINHSDTLYPSVFGGISIITSKNKIYHPWSPQVEFILLKKQNNYFEWIMFVKDEFYYKYSVNYKFSVDNIKIQFIDLGRNVNKDAFNYDYAEAYALYLDRCENAINPHIIGVPYLTTFNILLANEVFVSMYFDWTKTNASQLLPYNTIYSNSSVYYSQYALYNKMTNGKRNKLDETIILKVSRNIDDVFPDINHPISPYRNESIQRIVYDDWMGFNSSLQQLQKLKASGISNLWHILHNWQKYGYDVALPDVYPANSDFGGNTELLKISDFNKSNGNLFSLHENYIDIFKLSSHFKNSNLANYSDGNFIFNWLNPNNLDSSFIVKPERVISILSPISSIIHNELGTTASYHDVSSSYDPSKFVDYDHNVKDAGKFIQFYNVSKQIADTLRKIHKGPVSGEGLAHFLYAGFYDDFCAQIHTAKSLPGAFYNQTEKLGGFYKPLFVNFDLLKLKEKTFVHGVGYYSRFFYNSTTNWGSIGFSKDSTLMYAATEIAFGHGAFIGVDSYNIMEQAEIEYKYVYPLQLKYADAAPIKIFYRDIKSNKLLTASDYIRKYPETFDDFFSPDFMGQLYVKYENGVEVFVNRHPSIIWDIGSFKKFGFYSFNAVYNGNQTLYSGNSNGGNFVLPNSNGWIGYFSN